MHTPRKSLRRSRIFDPGSGKAFIVPMDHGLTCGPIPGLGDVDWGKLFSVLGDLGYKGPVCIEVEDRAYEGSLKRRKQALIQSARYLRQYLPE